MGISKYLGSALTVASVAYAQSSCGAPSTTLTAGGDVKNVAGCQTWTGDLVIQTGAAVDNTLSLDGLKKLDGKLDYENAGDVETFTAKDLTDVTGPMKFAGLSNLSKIDFGSLETASDIVYQGLANLGSLGFVALSSAGNVTVDNTGITTMDGIANASKLAGIAITDNTQLSKISLSLSSISEILIGPNDVSAQGGVSFSAENLETADLVVVRNCSSVDIPMLTSMTGALGLIGNTFESFEAANLTNVGALVIDDNTKLSNMSFPALQNVNGSKSLLEVANNTKLLKIEGFGDLKVVTGGVNLFGAFDSASFPSLNKIGGALNVDTSSKNFQCDKLPQKGSGPVRGNVNCQSGDSNVKSGTAAGGDTSQSPSAAPMEIPSNFMPIFGIIASLLFL